MPPVTPLPFATSFEAENVNGKTSKTSALKGVEGALGTYVRSSSVGNLRALTQALGDWKLTKVKTDPAKNWTDTARAASIRKLSAWLEEESRAVGVFPTSRPLWGGNHNCYAYAMKCQMPEGAGQIAWTGKKSGIKIGTDFPLGVTNDGRAQAAPVAIVKLANEQPLPVPPRQGGGNYLVAMVSNVNGFHFLRRRESTGLWTHKNGGSSAVETHFYDRAIEQPVAMTDAVVARILADPKLIGCSMTFHCYLSVPSGGIEVKG